MAMSCGNKHMIVIAAILALVGAICLGTIAYASSRAEALAAPIVSQAAALETRMRTAEREAAANAVRFEMIIEKLKQIEARTAGGKDKP